MRFVAPAGSPIEVRDLVRWGTVAASTPRVADALKALVRQRLGVRHVFLTSTGRAGMTLALKAMHRLAPDRDEVVLPSYTCYSVAASAIKAGLRIRIADISPETLDYAPASLALTDFSRVLVLVATNLFGFPGNLPALEALARERGVFLIDDAAQAMGATVAGRHSGTWGDAGLFSFDKGKNVTAIDGGVVVTRSDELAAVLQSEIDGLSGATLSSTVVHVAKALAYSVMLRPSLYGIATLIPGLGLGSTIFSTAFPLEQHDTALTALALTMMPRLDEFTAARRANAMALQGGFQAVDGVTLIRPTEGSTPVYLRLPVLCATGAARDVAIAALKYAGIGATGSYPASLLDVPDIQRALAGPAQAGSAGRQVARRILTLPTHPLVTGIDVARMVETVAAHTDTRNASGSPIPRRVETLN